MEHPESSIIVYFDGDCNLCNRFVDFLISRDAHRRLRYASFQSAWGQKALARLGHPGDMPLKTVLLESSGRFYQRSDAALRILAGLGGLYRFASLLLWIPGFFRDGLYAWVSENRYRWFGRRFTCRLPNEAERALFLN